MRSPTDLRVLSFPSADATFHADVLRARETIDEDLPDAEGRIRLADLLRPSYHAVDVVPQDLLAQHELVPLRVWYVYRDGRVRPYSERRERLYVALASARRTYDASREAMADAHEAARAAGFHDGDGGAAGVLDPVEGIRQSTRRIVSSE